MTYALFHRSKQWFTHLGQRTIDLFFPPTCAGCHHIGDYFCAACAQAVEAVEPRICQRCRQFHPHETDLCNPCRGGFNQLITSVQSAAYFAHPIQPAIHALKYKKQPNLARLLARYLVATFQQSTHFAHRIPDLVIPVPIYQDRLAERGYNQSALLAAHFCQATAIPFAPKWLQKARATRSQVGLNAKDRQKNVANAFQASPHVSGYTILIIDDVYTTGATLSACATALKRAGAKEVGAFTLATRKTNSHHSTTPEFADR